MFWNNELTSKGNKKVSSVSQSRNIPCGIEWAISSRRLFISMLSSRNPTWPKAYKVQLKREDTVPLTIY